MRVYRGSKRANHVYKKNVWIDRRIGNDMICSVCKLVETRNNTFIGYRPGRFSIEIITEGQNVLKQKLDLFGVCISDKGHCLLQIQVDRTSTVTPTIFLG